MFEGDKGRIFVNRGTLSGKPVERLRDDPLPAADYQLYRHDNLELASKTASDEFELAGNYPPIANHVANFFDCVKTGTRRFRTLLASIVPSARATWSIFPFAWGAS